MESLGIVPAVAGYIATHRQYIHPWSAYVPLPTFLFFAAAYKLAAPNFPDVRSRAYILSSISAFCMTLVSLPFVAAYLSGGYPRVWEAGQTGWTSTLAAVVVPAFATYLFSDLFIGWFAYPTEIGFLTGWFHHFVYIGLMLYLVASPQRCIFVAGAVMELPTFDLGISHLFPAVRHDERFLVLMTLTRILLNVVLFVDSVRPATRAMTGNWVPTVMLGSALALHSFWMYGGVTGYLRRRAKAAKARATAKVEKPVELDLSTPASGLATPEESPLVTPHTPGQPSLIIPQHLFPNISIPTMANIPIPNIPTLSGMAAALPQAKANLEHLSFGLREAKEAMRERWHEQREMWTEQRERLAAAGLRLRRRDTDPAGVPVGVPAGVGMD